MGEASGGSRQSQRRARLQAAMEDPLFRSDVEDVERDFRFADAERDVGQLTVCSTSDLTVDQKQGIVVLCGRAFGQDFSDLFAFADRATEPHHVLAQRDGRLVGHAMWSTRWLQPSELPAQRTAYVDAVATDPDLWSQGIGSAVLERLIQETSGYALLGLSTRRVTFYERLGWERWRGPLAVRTESGLVATPDETVLIRRTPLSPPLDLDSLLTVDWRPGGAW